MLARGASSSSNAGGSSPNARKKVGAARKAALVKSTKDTYVYELVETAVASTFLFRSMPLDRLKEIVSYMQRFEFEAGRTVMTQVRLSERPNAMPRPVTAPAFPRATPATPLLSDLPKTWQGDKGDYFYVLESGTYEVYVKNAEGDNNLVHTYVSSEALRYPSSASSR